MRIDVAIKFKIDFPDLATRPGKELFRSRNLWIYEAQKLSLLGTHM